MSNQRFTDDFVALLRAHPGVEKATVLHVTFTPAFKKHICLQLINGVSIRQIFEEAGINPDLLGQKRIDGIRTRVLREYRASLAPQKAFPPRPNESDSDFRVRLSEEIRLSEAYLKKLQDQQARLTDNDS